MKATIVALGSRGDVQPGIALGRGMRAAGIDVTIATYSQFKPLADRHGLRFSQVEGDILAILTSPEGQAVLQKVNPLELIKLMRESLNGTFDQTAADLMNACDGSDVIISIGPVFPATASIAEAMNRPIIYAILQPLYPTAAFPNPLVPYPEIGSKWINRATHRLGEELFWAMFRSMVNQARAGIYGQPPWPRFRPITRLVESGMPMMSAHSPSFIPRPADWPPSADVVGYWFLPESERWQPSAELLNFLESGSAPIYIGFGSMNTEDPAATARLAIDALEMTGQRGVLMRGWGGLQPEDVPDSICVIDETPHAWLFPRMKAVIHHGGAGTTAAGLRAGKPSLLIPFFADQPFWGHQVMTKGVGPKPIRLRRLNRVRLARRIDQLVNDSEMARRSAELGEQIRAEDGIGRAIDRIERAVHFG